MAKSLQYNDTYTEEQINSGISESNPGDIYKASDTGIMYEINDDSGGVSTYPSSSGGIVLNHVPGVEYDTGENWITGERIYRQSYEGAIPATNSSDTLITGVKSIIRSEGTIWNVQFNASVPWPINNGGPTYTYLVLTSNEIRHFHTSNYGGGTPNPRLEVTVYYTKL